jgi:hypothetical protein
MPAAWSCRNDALHDMLQPIYLTGVATPPQLRN